MKLDELTLGDVKQLQCMLGNKIETKAECCENGKIKIVILQRGWVVVGKYYQTGSQCKIEKGYVIRRWGTTEGLGQLAVCGPLTDTKLEATPTISFHELTVIATIDCEECKWKNKCS
jgi:hypothetical protein